MIWRLILKYRKALGIFVGGIFAIVLIYDFLWIYRFKFDDGQELTVHLRSHMLPGLAPGQGAYDMTATFWNEASKKSLTMDWQQEGMNMAVRIGYFPHEGALEKMIVIHERYWGTFTFITYNDLEMLGSDMPLTLEETSEILSQTDSIPIFEIDF